jgi:hypothetical protein
MSKICCWQVKSWNIEEVTEEMLKQQQWLSICTCQLDDLIFLKINQNFCWQKGETQSLTFLLLVRYARPTTPVPVTCNTVMLAPETISMTKCVLALPWAKLRSNFENPRAVCLWRHMLH